MHQVLFLGMWITLCGLLSSKLGIHNEKQLYEFVIHWGHFLGTCTTLF
jgi:hypothetical protein